MVTGSRFHEISECNHLILNPISLAKVLSLGDICHVGPTTTILDLACGKAEMLCRFADDHGSSGVGVDLSAHYLEIGRKRAEELGVGERVRLVEADAADTTCVEGLFGIVSCVGATWIGAGIKGTLEIMRARLKPGGFLVVGDVFWRRPPSARVREHFEQGQTFADLGGTLSWIEEVGCELVEMVVASEDDWDRYRATQWLNVADWLLANPEDPDAADMRMIRDAGRRDYLEEERDTLGWGLFVMR